MESDDVISFQNLHRRAFVTAAVGSPFFAKSADASARRVVPSKTGLVDASLSVVDKGNMNAVQRRTNEVVSQVNGIRQKRLGGTDVIVSEVGLGTQRWVSGDFNGPDEKLCFKLMDRAILNDGINLIDTAEQYPIPSDSAHPEGRCEEVIGKWVSQSQGRRSKIVIATKITGGTRITKKGIIEACDGSLKRLNTDYIDVYQFHWPARYTPQSNWGQSLEYKQVSNCNGQNMHRHNCIASHRPSHITGTICSEESAPAKHKYLILLLYAIWAVMP